VRTHAPTLRAMPKVGSARPAKRRSRTEVEEWAAELPDAYLLCRDVGHSWMPRDAWEDVKERCYVQVLGCTRCAAERHRRLDYRGQRLGQSYDYPDGYLSPAGSGALSAAGRADLRLVSFQRAFTTTDQLASRRASKGA
jgi:hypothetical protein